MAAPRGHDISFTLGDQEYGFSLYWEGKDPPLTVTSQETAESTAAFLKRDLPRIWHEWGGGAFHSLTPQNAAPLIYGNIAQYGVAPPVYAYTKKMRMRDAGVATTSGKVTDATVYASAVSTTELGLRDIPQVAFNYGGHVYFVLGNGDVLKSLNGVSDPYLVTNLIATNALNTWNEAASGTKTATKTTFSGVFNPVKVVPFNGAFYLVQSDETLPILMFDGADENGIASDAVWFKSSAVGGVADTAYWVKNNQGFDYFVTKSGRSTIKYINVSPLQTASYSSDYDIGETEGVSTAIAPITNLVSTGRVILVAKEDGVYTFDELGHSPNLTPHLKAALHPTNGAVAKVFGDYAYFQYFEGLYRINLKAKEISEIGGWVTPGLGLPNRTPINGPIIAIASDRDWLAVIVESNGSSWLGYGRERTDDDPPVGPIIWHFSEYDHEGTIVLLHRGVVSNATDAPRMWMGGDDGDNVPFLVDQYLPRSSTALGDVEGDGPMRFAPEGEIYLPTDPIGDANALKYVLASNIQANGVSMPSASFDHQVRLSDTAEWTSLGICTDPEAYVGLPPEGLTGGYQVDQRLLAFGPDDAPPSLYALRTRFAVIPEAVGVRKYRLRIGKGAQSAGGFSQKALYRDWAIINALTRGGKIRGHDRTLGDRLICRVEQGYKATPIDWRADGSAVAFAVEIEVTVYAQGQSIIRYDDPLVATYDSGSLVTGG